jgi:hypothetical protein
MAALAIAGMLVLSIEAGADPPPDPISIDATSASLVACLGKTPADIYGMGALAGCDAAGPGPVLEIPESIYGLGTFGPVDDQDGHSAGEIDAHSVQTIYFSGETLSAGVPGSDYDHQAIRSQAEGDRYVSNGSTTISPAAVMSGAGPAAIAGPAIPTSPLTGLPGGLHLLSVNQTAYNEIPTIDPPAYNLTIPAIDDMDALELEAFDTDSDNVHDLPIFFTLDLVSASLPFFGIGTASILVAPPGGASHLYAPFPALGLAESDMIDAIAVWDDGDLIALGIPGVDHAIYSLAPGSPALLPGSPIPACFAAGCSPADIFVTDFAGASELFLPAAAIGMLPTDNVDALDVEIGAPQIHPVPEPGVLLQLVSGTGFLIVLAKRRRKSVDVIDDTESNRSAYWILRRESIRIEREAID